MHAPDQLLDQVEQAAVGPVDVLEHQHGRLLRRGRLDEAPYREEQRLAILRDDMRVDAEDDGEMTGDHLGIGYGEPLALGPQLRQHHVRLVVLEDACELLDLRGEGAVGARLAVGQAAAAHGAPAACRHDPAELGREPRLADAGWPEHGDQVRRPRGCPLPDALEHGQLAHATDELGAWPAVPAGHALGQPHLDRQLLALGQYRLGNGIVDQPVRAAVRFGADQHTARGGGGLQARGGVDDVARHHRLSPLGPGADGDQRLAGIDGDPHLGAQGRPDGQCRPHRPLGVVAVGGGCAEHADHGVADELLDHPAERFDLVADAVVVRREDGAHVLGVERLGARGEADQVDEDDRDDPPLLPRRRLAAGQRASAGQAVLGDRRVLLPACGTECHGSSLRPSGASGGQELQEPPGPWFRRSPQNVIREQSGQSRHPLIGAGVTASLG